MKKLTGISLLLVVAVVLFFTFMPGKSTTPIVAEKGANKKAETATTSTSSEAETPPHFTAEGNTNPPPTTIEEVQIYADQKTDIHTFLDNWRDAWQDSSGPDGNIDNYISFYSDNFKAAGLDKKGWADRKEKRNQKKEWIKVAFNDISIQILGDEITAQVIFQQEYNSSNYSDNSMKQLTIRNEESGWKILSEQ